MFNRKDEIDISSERYLWLAVALHRQRASLFQKNMNTYFSREIE